MPTLLIVDDEARILTALGRSLRNEAFEILTAESPREAIAILEDRPIDLILSDQKMPGMSGMELLAVASNMRPTAVRMLITGWTEAVSRDELDALGVSALIPKPWDDAELKTLLRRHLDPGRVGKTGDTS